jgi:hypothetical protein
MEVNGQIRIPAALPPRKEPPELFEKLSNWVPAEAQMLLKDENLSLMPTGVAIWGGGSNHSGHP